MERKFEMVYKKDPLGETPVSSHARAASEKQPPGGEFSGRQAGPLQENVAEKAEPVKPKRDEKLEMFGNNKPRMMPSSTTMI
ncbi:MAG: hypothetical protein NUW08_01020 [Candidatus Uhrbacteria bacterium]|nr:hypothetical protein [Candidatus Uhrbacteria bacterium]